MPKRERFEKTTEPGCLWVGKSDEGKPIIYGFGIISKVRDKTGAWVDYYDTQDEHVPEDIAEKAGARFMKLGGAGKVMHVGPAVAKCVYAFPMTTSILEKLEPEAAKKFTRSGLAIGFECDEELANKARNGEYTGFSLGGWITTKIVEADKTAAGKRASAKGKPRQRRVVLALDLDEFSLVDYPAAEPATIATIKHRVRVTKAWVDDATVPNMMTSEAEGHVHMLCCGPMHTAGETSNNEMLLPDGDVGYHSHPWQRDPASGEITIGASLGHTHEVQMVAPVSVQVAVVLTPEVFAEAVAASASVDEYGTKRDEDEDAESANLDNESEIADNDCNRENTMPTAEEKVAQLEKTNKSLAGSLVEASERVTKMLTLSVDEFAHLVSLPIDDQAAFVKLDKAGRTAALKAADEANPVVHTDKRGHVYRRTDDRRLVDAAKAADTATEKLAASERSEKAAVYKARAATELKHAKGTIDAKAAMLAAVDGIGDGVADSPSEKLKGECLAMVVAFDAACKVAMTREGIGGGEKDQTALVVYNAALKKFADDRKTTEVLASEDFLRTTEGKSLYDATLTEKRARSQPQPT